MIDLKNNKLAEEDGYKHDGNSENEWDCNIEFFFEAGFDTFSIIMSFVLYKLLDKKSRHLGES